MKLPPHISADDKVVLFDGVCKLCNGWSQFLIKHDKNGIFKLCSVQSSEGADILLWFGFPTSSFDTMLYVEGCRIYTQSDAFLQIVSQLPKPWCYMSLVRIVPRPVRNWFYDRIALNRYWLFGRYDQCLLPNPEQHNRFLDRH